MINYGTCPVCNGTSRRSASSEPYKTVYAGYDATTDTLPCYNCGSQYMFGKSSGKVRLRLDNNEPCVHSYKGQNVGRCLTQYTCQHCGDSHQIDSGD